MLSIFVPLVFRDAENPDLVLWAGGVGGGGAVGIVSARIVSGPAQLGESSHPGNGQGDGTAWRRAVEMRDFQPVAFSTTDQPRADLENGDSCHTVPAFSLRKQESGFKSRKSGTDSLSAGSRLIIAPPTGALDCARAIFTTMGQG